MKKFVEIIQGYNAIEVQNKVNNRIVYMNKEGYSMIDLKQSVNIDGKGIVAQAITTIIIIFGKED